MTNRDTSRGATFPALHSALSLSFGGTLPHRRQTMDDDDLIVVDDDVAQPPQTPQAGPSSAASRAPPTGIRSSLRQRRTPPSYAAQMEDDELETRRTRSSTYRASSGARPQPKLKLKLSEKAAAQAPGMSFLGPYDRELDSDDEDLVFEEQFILRMPPGEDSERLRKMVQNRDVASDVWFKFKGASTCLVDALAGADLVRRLEACSVPHWQQAVLCEARRPAMYHRITEDDRQQTNVQSYRHMSGCGFLIHLYLPLLMSYMVYRCCWLGSQYPMKRPS